MTECGHLDQIRNTCILARAVVRSVSKSEICRSTCACV